VPGGFASHCRMLFDYRCQSASEYPLVKVKKLANVLGLLKIPNDYAIQKVSKEKIGHIIVQNRSVNLGFHHCMSSRI